MANWLFNNVHSSVMINIANTISCTLKMYLDAEIDNFDDIDHCPFLVRILSFDLVGGLAGGKLVVQQRTQ